MRAGPNVTIAAYGEGAAVELSDFAIVGTRSTAARPSGNAIAIEEGARLELARGVVEDNAAGIFLSGEATAAALDEVLIRGTEGRADDGGFGRGLDVWNGATLVAAHTLIAANREVGVHVRGASATLTDAVVRETRSVRDTGILGMGLVAFDSIVEVERALVVGNRSHAVVATQVGSDVTLRDVHVADTNSEDGDGRFGRGLTVLRGATLTATRVAVSASHGVGLIAAREGRAEIADVAITATVPEACVEDTCACCGGGVGITVMESGLVRGRAFEVSDSALIGLQILGDGAVELADGVVRGSPIGLNIQGPGFDPAVLATVRFEDNARNVAREDVAAPALSDAVELGAQ
jgi:hypothetical protein